MQSPGAGGLEVTRTNYAAATRISVSICSKSWSGARQRVRYVSRKGTHEENLVGLRAVNRELLAQAEMATRADRIVLDMDSSESPVHGAQEGSAYNGHFASVCYHPLFLFND